MFFDCDYYGKEIILELPRCNHRYAIFVEVWVNG